MHAITVDTLYDAMPMPAILAFADDPARRGRLVQIAAATGGRLVAEGPLSTARERIGRQAGRSALIVADVIADDGDMLDNVLATIDAVVRVARFAAIIVTRRETLDIVVARAADPAMTILVEPSDMELSDAMRQAQTPAEAMLSESSGEAKIRRLAQLSEEVGRIARALVTLSGCEDGVPARDVPSGDMSVAVQAAPSDLAVVRMLLRLRRLRDQFLEPALFADPAWDMLLDLKAAQLERRRVAVSSLCIAAAVPPTTALRWITTMTEQGLFARCPDPDDGRRIFIGLSETASAAMARYVQAARRTFALAG
jgi:DNA-binding MarR family transcriptional regulator